MGMSHDRLRGHSFEITARALVLIWRHIMSRLDCIVVDTRVLSLLQAHWGLRSGHSAAHWHPFFLGTNTFTYFVRSVIFKHIQKLFNHAPLFVESVVRCVHV